MAERLFWRFAGDGGMIGTSSAAQRFPAANMLDSRRGGKVWKTTGVSASEYITMDLGADYDISAFALLDHNFTAGYTGLLLSGDSTFPIPSSPELSQVVTFRSTHLVEFFNTVTVRYLQFEFTKPSAATVAQASRLLIGSHYDMSRGSKTRRWSHDDLGDHAAARSGQVYSDPGGKPVKLELDFSALPQADWEEIKAMVAFGMDSPVVYSVDHENEPVDWLMYGLLSRLPKFDQIVPRDTPTRTLEYSGALEFMEAL